MVAADVGANHQRDRIWIVANTNNARIERREQQSENSNGKGNVADTSQLFSNGGNNNARISMEREAQSKSGNDSGEKNVPNTDLSQQQGRSISSGIYPEHSYACNSRWWQIEPDVGRMANGVAAGVDRLKAIGNGQVPLCAATAWKFLTA
jgi:DNA (cytosine-5)-methyltransferase 1